MRVRIKPLLKYELKNMGFALVVGVVLLFIVDFVGFMSLFNNMFADMMKYGHFYDYFSCISVIVGSDVLFALGLSFLQFLNVKKDFLSAMPYTRKSLLLSKNFVGYGVIAIKNVILLLGMLAIYSKYQWYIEDVSFYYNGISNFELSSVNNILMLGLTSFVVELSVYSLLCFCYSVAGGVKLGVALIILGVVFLVAVDNICYEYNIEIIYTLELFTAYNVREYMGYLTLIFAVLFAVFTALSYRYYLNRGIEINYLLFPYKMTAVLFLVMFGTIMASLSFVISPLMAVAIFIASIVVIITILRCVYKKQGGGIR